MMRPMKPPENPLAVPEPWDLVAPGYALDIVPIFEPFAEAALALAAPARDARIVDVACGPGTLSLLAAPRVATVDALDFSAAMLERCRERVAAAGLGNIELRQGDGQALPYPDGSFDAAFSMFGLMFFPARDRGLAELRRVLRPGGRAVVSSWQVAPEGTTMREIIEGLAQVMPNAPRPGVPGPLGDADVFAAELGAAGFREIAVHAVVHTDTAPSVDALWSSLQRSMAPLVMMKQRMPPAMFAQVEAAIVDRLRARFGSGPVPTPMPAWLGTGVA
jgi:SAM-dependent methyltransferase